MSGVVETIHIGPSEDLRPVEEAVAVAGHGLEGDRNLATGERAPGSGEDLTLIEAEAIEGVAADTGIELRPGESRRNLMTRGIGLNDLVGRRFAVGEVECLGVELCEPCNHLEKLTQPGVLRGLVHRAGLRCDILRGGTIHVGDAVRELPGDAAAGPA